MRSPATEANQYRTCRAEVLAGVRDLFVACRKYGAPHDLRPYNDACGIKRDVKYADVLGDGQLRWLDDEKMYEIVINPGLPRQTQRFVWAHEIAHSIIATHADGSAEAPRAERKLARSASFDVVEALCDEIATELLVPDALLRCVTDESAVSLRTASRIAHKFDVPLTTAAIRLVRFVSVKCWLIIWQVREDPPGHRQLAQHMVFTSNTAKRPARIPDVVDVASPPFKAHLTGRLKSGPWNMDFGEGPTEWYVECLPSRIRSRAAVMALVHVDNPLEMRQDSDQGNLF